MAWRCGLLLLVPANTAAFLPRKDFDRALESLVDLLTGKYADVPAPAPRGSFAALAARASRDARNNREERTRNGLVEFARGSNGGA